MSYLTIDLDYFHSINEFEVFINQISINNISLVKDHHDLINPILQSKEKEVINIDWHNDLNLDILDSCLNITLHCGNWVTYLLHNGFINSYKWFHPVEYAYNCSHLEWDTLIKVFSNCKMNKYSGLELFTTKEVKGIGVCVSPGYHCHKENEKRLLKVLIDYCIFKGISINGRDERYYQDSEIRKRLLTFKDS